MKVLWIDPGERVGYATAEVGKIILNDGGSEKPTLDVLTWGISSLKPFALLLLKRAQDYDVVGLETYHIRPDKLRAHAGSDVPTLQLVGMIKLACWDAQAKRTDGGPRIVEQPAARQTKGWGAANLHASPDILDVIQEAQYDLSHDEGHHGSALLHLFSWFHDTYCKDTP